MGLVSRVHCIIWFLSNICVVIILIITSGVWYTLLVLFLCCQLLPLTLLFKFYGYIPISFVLLLSCSVVTPPNLLLSLRGVTVVSKGTPSSLTWPTFITSVGHFICDLGLCWWEVVSGCDPAGASSSWVCCRASSYCCWPCYYWVCCWASSFCYWVCCWPCYAGAALTETSCLCVRVWILS
jgi:hypothetical protein